ncbi:hypothetical protein HaLaN_23904, partial [Haematococcus lacustris]
MNPTEGTSQDFAKQVAPRHQAPPYSHDLGVAVVAGLPGIQHAAPKSLKLCMKVTSARATRVVKGGRVKGREGWQEQAAGQQNTDQGQRLQAGLSAQAAGRQGDCSGQRAEQPAHGTKATGSPEADAVHSGSTHCCAGSPESGSGPGRQLGHRAG